MTSQITARLDGAGPFRVLRYNMSYAGGTTKVIGWTAEVQVPSGTPFGTHMHVRFDNGRSGSGKVTQVDMPDRDHLLIHLTGTELTDLNEIEDRRQRAREAAHDTWEDRVSPRAAVETAIEVATQVKITEEAIEEFRKYALIPRAVVENALRHTLTALGFEVIE